MSFPPPLTLSVIKLANLDVNEDIFNLLDWPISDQESLMHCINLPPDKLKQMVSSKAFWNAVMNRWGLKPLVEAWTPEQLSAIVSALQHIPKEVQRSPRMGQALEKIFDEIVLLNIKGSNKLCACVNALEVEDIVPLLKAMDDSDVLFGEQLFASVLQNMEIPSQKEFLCKAAFVYSTPESMLPLLNEEQLKAVVPEDPDFALVNKMLSLNIPRITKVFLQKMPSDFFNKINFNLISSLPVQLIEYIQNPTMLANYIHGHLVNIEKCNHMRLEEILKILVKPENRWKLYIAIHCSSAYRENASLRNWTDDQELKCLIQPFLNQYKFHIDPFITEIHEIIFQAEANCGLSKLELAISKLGEEDFQFLLASILGPEETFAVEYLKDKDWLEVVLSIYHPKAKKLVLDNLSKVKLNIFKILPSMFHHIFIKDQILILRQAKELAKAGFPFEIHSIDPRIRLMNVPLEIQSLQLPMEPNSFSGEIQLIFGSKTVTAHLAILATELFFRKYLCKENREFPKKIVISLGDIVNENYVQALVDLSYTGIIKLSQLGYLSLKLKELPNEGPSEPRLKFLLNSPLYSDVTFKVNGRSFFAHKAILAARCPYFARLLYGGMRESYAKEIELKDISPQGFLKVLEYLYTDSIQFDASEAVELLAQADLFEIEVLKKQCLDCIRKHKAEYEEETLKVVRLIEPSL